VIYALPVKLGKVENDYDNQGEEEKYERKGL